MTASEAFLAEAQSDWEVYLLLAQQGKSLPACHPLHYLQMTLEKASKATILAGGAEVPRSHAVGRRLILALRTPDMARRMGYPNHKRGVYRALIDAVGPLVVAIEELHPAIPAGQDGPNVEYPWRERTAAGDSEWIAPSRHEFDLHDRLQHGNGLLLLRLLRILLERGPVV